ncbi:hypothetical protein SAPIO_CDS6533 [Scedosporium apiospermum]|uniref:Uncharacterized protein n=1 Tax=Pseudallescheria apiosperma TaxID=563466 RepID=A0A084G3P7_PSEDA|nr:uncharacterized protein SAPIO_CDS6533 [Scedosporium apiospermum]KEZ41959.1 hypothetical protein SAPIO_CDS6533 [Scedosporium apiospermum]
MAPFTIRTCPYIPPCMAPPPDCGFRDGPFEALPGIGSLDRGEETVTDKDISDRTGNWRGITVHDLVIAYKRGAIIEDKLNVNVRAAAAAAAAGVVRIPVCSYETAWKNWETSPEKRGEMYPCDDL